MSPDDPLPTEPLPQEELPASQADPWSLTADGYDKAELPATAPTLCITVARSSRQVLFPPPIDEICLGRRDAPGGVFPDLDLAPDGGVEEGVSRRHAKIYQMGNRIFVEDVGSANGTFLNNKRITPYLPHLLQEGDTLQLGRLRLGVKFGYD